MYFTKKFHQIVKMRLRISILSNRFLSKYNSDTVPEFTNISIFRQTATIGRRKGGKNLQLSGKRPRPEGGARSGEICYIIMEKISPLRSRRLGKRLRRDDKEDLRLSFRLQSFFCHFDRAERVEKSAIHWIHYK